jgi:hypothetical protein
MYSRLSRNAETGDSDKEALFASAGGVEVSEFLGGELDKRLEGWALELDITQIY